MYVEEGTEDANELQQKMTTQIDEDDEHEEDEEDGDEGVECYYLWHKVSCFTSI